jgi:hypothetical protein
METDQKPVELAIQVAVIDRHVKHQLAIGLAQNKTGIGVFSDSRAKWR